MFNDPTTLDRVGTMLAGVAGTAALAATAPVSGVAAIAAGAGILQIVCAGRSSVVARLSRRRSDAAQMLDDYLATYRDNWREWSGVASLTDAGDAENAILNFEEYFTSASADVLPPPERIMGLGRDVDALVTQLLGHAAARAPERFGRHPGNRHSRDFFRRVTSGGLTALLRNPDFAYLLMPAFQDQVLGRFDTLEAHVTEILRRLPEQPAESGVSARALIRLARRIAEDVEDPEHAFVELSRAVEIAERVQAEGRIGSNLGDFVDEVLRRVAELSAASDNDAAAAEIDAALAREEAESRARQIRLLDAGLEQDILRRNAESAVGRLKRKAELELPEGAALFDALQSVYNEWYELGRDKGLNFELEVAIALAKVASGRSGDANQRGTALVGLGIALRTLGAREAGTARLREAVAAHRRALEEQSRSDLPLHWANAQMNLGIVLWKLGEREAGTAGLREAVAAHRRALEEQKRDRVPFDWANTQMNLGNALHTLGQREAGSAHLEEAVAAHRLALEERIRDQVPIDWAKTQMNLGNALLSLGEREASKERLEEAVAAHRLALEEMTRDRMPIDWAATQNNLGNALAALERQQAGATRLEETAAAYSLALRELTRERVPIRWAMLQGNLCSVELTFFDKTGEPAHLDAAERYLAAARGVFEEAGATHYLAQAHQLAAKIAKRREGR